MNNRDTFKAGAGALALVAALVAGAITAPALAAEPLRDSARDAFKVCADPDNLPFTKEQGTERGLYIELAELVAAKLGAPIEYTWYYTNNQRRAMRNTVLAKACDAVFALPSDYRARGVQKSQAFLSVGYAVVAAPNFAFKSLDDLRGKRIAVQFSTTPHIVLNTLPGFTTTTFKDTEQIFAALAKGEMDVAFLWGPSAGYDNQKHHDKRWRVTPVSGHDMAGEMSVGVRAELPALLKSVNAALAELKPQIATLALKYGFPTQAPLDLSMPGVLPATQAAVPVVVPVAAAVAVNDPARPDPAVAIKAGRVRFNDQCSHCHGADGYSPVRERDLRRLGMRYDAKWPEVALTTIRNGRTEQGMPPWKDILKEHEVQELMGFLATLQK